MARELEENVEQKPYFEAVQMPSPETDEGTREMGELYPFLISGGSNTVLSIGFCFTLRIILSC